MGTYTGGMVAGALVLAGIEYLVQPGFKPPSLESVVRQAFHDNQSSITVISDTKVVSTPDGLFVAKIDRQENLPVNTTVCGYTGNYVANFYKVNVTDLITGKPIRDGAQPRSYCPYLRFIKTLLKPPSRNGRGIFF